MCAFDWGGFAGGALGALGSVAGGLLGGSGGGGHSYQYYLDRDYAHREKITKNQASWVVEGAKKAGLHPLAAMGIQAASGSTHQIGGDYGNGKDYSWLSDAGQGIGRAAGALLSKEDRAKQQQYDEARMGLQLENSRLQNEYLNTQIDQTKQDMAMQLARSAERSLIKTGQPPGFQLGVDGRVTRQVIDGQNDATSSSLFTVKPAELVASHPQTPNAEAGSHPELKWTRTGLGGYAPARSQALEEAMEDDTLGAIRYNIRNGIGSFMSDQRFAPPRRYLPDGGKSGRYYWLYDHVNGDWFPADVREPTFTKFKRQFGFGR